MRFSNPKNIDLGIVWVAVLPVVLSQRTIYLHNEKVKKVQLLCYYNSLQRLKNKLGTRQLLTAELLLDGSHAYKVSEEWKVQQLDPLQLYLQLVYNANLKRRRLRISRIDGQTRKIENPDNLPEEHLWGSIFENVIVIF